MERKIYIAVPNTGSIDPELVMNLIYWSNSKMYKVQVHLPTGLVPLDNARNTIVKDFLETDCTHILWIDSDIIPPIQTLDRLIQADKDAIGAACFSMKNDHGEYFPYPVTLRYNEEEKYQVYYGSGIEEVDAVGGACVLVKRELYEALERPYEYHYHRDGTLALTCDFDIWQKAQAKGFKLFVDFDILCDHKRKCSILGFQNLVADITRKKNK